MFYIRNVFNKNLTTLEYTYSDYTPIEFVLGNTLGRKNKNELDTDKQFILLNKYLEYKGDEYRKELYIRLQESNSNIMLTINSKDITPLPMHIVSDILAMLDILDIFNFLKHVYMLTPPASLKEDFNPLIESDDRGSRIQTYLKDDYIELVALILIVKATIGPIAHFAYIKSKDIDSLHKDYILFHFYRNSTLFNTAPMQKLLGLVDKLIYLPTNTPQDDSIRVFEKFVPKDELPVFVLSSVIIQRISVANVMDDSSDKNIITKIYVYVNNKIKLDNDDSKAVKNKEALTDLETGKGDKESIIESYRILSDINMGIEVESDWSVGTIEMILKQLPAHQKDKINKDIITDAMQFVTGFKHGMIDKIQIELLSIIFSKVIDPRSLAYIKLDSILNLMAVGFSYLWSTGYKNIALILTSQREMSNVETFSYNSTVNKNRISKELKDELDELFPYKRVINADTEVNITEEYISSISTAIDSYRWTPFAYDKYLSDPEIDRKVVPHDIKTQLCNFIIENERNKYE